VCKPSKSPVPGAAARYEKSIIKWKSVAHIFIMESGRDRSEISSIDPDPRGGA